MVTFKNVQSSEHFVDSLTTDSPLKPYRYKVALDYGSAYHFRFLEHLPDDPYGLVVDRCARIAKFAVAGTVLCTDDYRQQVGRSADYVSMGAFALHGFRKPEKLFVRCLVAVDSDEYLKPIVNALNKEAQRVAAYRYVGRKVTTEFMRQFGEGGARPFLARELLNVPKLPYSPKEFDDLMSTADNDEIQHEYVGYFVDWQGTFDKYTRDEYDITVLLKAGNSEGPYGHVYVNLLLPHSSFELVHQLKKGQRLRARGIITTIFLRIITLNYVDLETVAKS
jgi:hypothetical protein